MNNNNQTSHNHLSINSIKVLSSVKLFGIIYKKVAGLEDNLPTFPIFTLNDNFFKLEIDELAYLFKVFLGELKKTTKEINK